LIKKNKDIVNTKHFQNSIVYYLPFNFVVYLTFLLFYGLEILSMIFGKSWNIFQKNIDIWNPKLFINFIIYFLFF